MSEKPETLGEAIHDVVRSVEQNMRTWDEFAPLTHDANGNYIVGSYSLDAQAQRRVLNGQTTMRQELRRNGYK